MFFPIGDTNVERGSKPIFSYSFIIINILVFFYQVSLGSQLGSNFVYQYGNLPVELLHRQDLYTLVTSTFLHGGWMHLLGNMLFLWVFADNIEATIGSFKFVLFYISGGVIASLAHALLNTSSSIPCVGASGSIAACLGAYLIIFPKSQIKMLFLIFFTTFNVRAIFFLGFWIVQQFISGFGSLGVRAENSGVAYWAHIGGFLFGLTCGYMWRNKVRTIDN
jgi:membrane associated rhomboid family serine protease